MIATDGKTRCGWVGLKPHLIRYHDEEWGVPVHDDRKHFEMLLLEGAQAGLTWETILLRREGYRKAFAGFDPTAVARLTSRRRAALMKDAGIIRNRLKIEAAVTNAQAFLEVQGVWIIRPVCLAICRWEAEKHSLERSEPSSGYHRRK